jgi:hypothetical protein
MLVHPSLGDRQDSLKRAGICDQEKRDFKEKRTVAGSGWQVEVSAYAAGVFSIDSCRQDERCVSRPA